MNTPHRGLANPRLQRENKVVGALLTTAIMVAPMRAYVVTSVGGANLSMFRLAILVLGITWGCNLLLRSSRINVNKELLVITILTLWFLVSLLCSSLGDSLTIAYGLTRFQVKFVGFFAIVFFAIVIQSAERLELAVRAYILSAALPLLVAFWQLQTFLRTGRFAPLPWSNIREDTQTALGLVYGDLPRLTSTFLEPNYMGMFFSSVALIGFAALGAKAMDRVSRRLLLMTVIVTTVTGLVLSLSLSAGLGFGAGLMALAMVLRVRPALLIVVTVASVGVSLFGSTLLDWLGAAWSLEEFIALRLEDRLAGGGSDAFGREVFFRAALNGFLSHPIFGMGIGGLENNLGLSVLSGHSAFITVLGEQGLFGFIPIMALFTYLVVALWRLSRSSLAQGNIVMGRLAAGLLAALVSMCVSNLGYDAMFSFDSAWSLLGLVVATIVVGASTTRTHAARTFHAV